MPARFSAGLLLLWMGPAAAATRTFAIESSASTVRVHVGKTGIGSFAGHEHEVVARSVQGEVAADFEDLSRSSVEVLVNAASLTAVAGDLSLHGAVRPIVVPLQVELRGDALTGTGKLVVKQTDFGIERTAAAGGLVKVDDEVTVTFRIIARAEGS